MEPIKIRYWDVGEPQKETDLISYIENALQPTPYMSDGQVERVHEQASKNSTAIAKLVNELIRSGIFRPAQLHKVINKRHDNVSVVTK